VIAIESDEVYYTGHDNEVNCLNPQWVDDNLPIHLSKC